MKTLTFKGTPVVIEDPANITFEYNLDSTIYTHIYNAIVNGSAYAPVVDCDKYYDGSYGIDVNALAATSGISLTTVPSARASNPQRLRVQFIIRDFLDRYPALLGLVQNIVTLAPLSIKNAEYLLGQTVSGSNFIDIKSIIDQVNRTAWSRVCDSSESQSGTSTLGTISETLLHKVCEDLVDDRNFFKVSQSDVQSYGDFVLMCLPNNLWISVKSNYARERLLASGYSNDILAAGFFQQSREFTNTVRIRNLQRAGFLAMYCPDVPVSEDQVNNGTNTYDEVRASYASRGLDMPRNINGKQFIRKLSELYDDLSGVLAESDIRRRTTVTF